MKQLRAELAGDYAIVSWTNKDGELISLPVYEDDDGWHAVGVYFKHGTSRSDPKFKAMYPCPHGFEPGGRILDRLEAL